MKIRTADFQRRCRMNMTSRIQLTIRIAAALAATSAALPSQAQSHRESCLGNPKFTPAFFLDYAASRPGYANGCIRDIAGGRAAVLLPSALETTDGLPVDRSTAPHAWGFLDEKGRVAIRPIFEAVSDFRHGLAAVRWQGKWGFIDKNGRMAVRPRFDTLEDMTEVGLAVALLDGRLLLIDRQGNPVGSPFEESCTPCIFPTAFPREPRSITYPSTVRLRASTTTAERASSRNGLSVKTACTSPRTAMARTASSTMIGTGLSSPFIAGSMSATPMGRQSVTGLRVG